MKRISLLLSLLLAVASTNARADSESPFSVLFVADSHGVGTFGLTLDANLRSIKGAVVRTYASCGSSVQSWLKGTSTNCGYLEKVFDGLRLRVYQAKISPTPLLATLLAKETFSRGNSTTVIALGSNMIEPLSNGPKAIEAVKRSVEDALALVEKSGTTCIWVGPPKMRRFGDKGVNAIYDLLKPILKGDGEEPRCLLIDSRKHTHYPPKVADRKNSGDGIHYDFPAGKPIAEEWARAVFGEVRAVIGR